MIDIVLEILGFILVIGGLVFNIIVQLKRSEIPRKNAIKDPNFVRYLRITQIGNFAALVGFIVLAHESPIGSANNSLTVLTVLALLSAGVIAGFFSFSYKESAEEEVKLATKIDVSFTIVFFLLFGLICYYLGAPFKLIKFGIPIIMWLILTGNTYFDFWDYNKMGPKNPDLNDNYQGEKSCNQNSEEKNSTTIKARLKIEFRKNISRLLHVIIYLFAIIISGLTISWLVLVTKSEIDNTIIPIIVSILASIFIASNISFSKFLTPKTTDHYINQKASKTENKTTDAKESDQIFSKLKPCLLIVLCLTIIFLGPETIKYVPDEWKGYTSDPAEAVKNKNDISPSIKVGITNQLKFLVFGDTRTELALPWGRASKNKLIELLRERYGTNIKVAKIDTSKREVIFTTANNGSSDTTKLWYSGLMQDSLYKISSTTDTIKAYHEYGIEKIYDRVAENIVRSFTTSKKYSLDFAIHTGDIVLWNDKIDNEYWKLFKNHFYDKLLKNYTSYRFFPVIGNHEYWKDSTASNYFYHFEHLKDPETGSNLHYYSFNCANSGFIFLCSGKKCEGGGYSGCWNCSEASYDEQISWMNNKMEEYASKNIKNIFITYHKPSFSSSYHEGLTAEYNPVYELCRFKRMHPRINIVVFNGHNHTTEYYNYEGIKIFVIGGGGATQYLKPDHDPDQLPENLFWRKVRKNKHNKKVISYNYLIVDVNDDKLNFQFHEYQGDNTFKEYLVP